MAVVREQSVSNIAGAATGTTVAYPNMSNTAGNFLIAHIGWQGTGVTLSGVSDTQNGAWTLLTPRTDEVSKCCLAYRENCVVASANNTITATFSGTAEWPQLVVVEYSGVRTTSSFDAQASGSSGGAGTLNLLTGNMTVTDGGLLFFGDEIFGVEDLTPGTSNGETWVEIINSSTTHVCEMRNKPPGTYAGTASQPNIHNWAMVAAAFKAVSATEIVRTPAQGPLVLTSENLAMGFTIQMPSEP